MPNADGRLEVIRPMGRPADPTEAEEAALWQAMRALKSPQDEDLAPEDYWRYARPRGSRPGPFGPCDHRAPAEPQAGMAPPRRKAAGERR